MNKQYRTLAVVAVALVMAALASLAVYRAVLQMPVREVEVANVQVVVASQTLPVGTRIEPAHLRVVAWPSRNPVAGAFADPAGLVNRGVITTILENEPVTSTKVASAEAGAGLPPIIPEGMRAISVRVNDVVGVAGFVVPGTRVDVLVTTRELGRGSEGQPMTRSVVSNIQVLTAGTKFDQEKSKDGQPIQASVVTLMVTPEDAERITLASTEGRITLALRNPLDVQATNTAGVRMDALLHGSAPPRPPVVQPRNRVARAVASPPPPPPPSVYTVETIRAAKRGEEVVR
jgi:pilus assembly protein CpaB